VDLFCGVGGLTHGLARGGIAVVAGVDFDPACRFAYESNNLAKFLHRDVRTLTAEDVSSSFGTAPIRLLAGCAPCQPFSTYSRARRGQRSDEMWDLLVEFGKLIHEVQPELVTMENVPELAQHGVFEAFLRDLGGYSVSYGIVECQRYGIPQTRKRLVLLASRLGSIRLVEPETPSFVATVRSAIGGLGPVGAGESDAIDAMHSACRLSEINLRRIRASQPGGTWRDWGDNLVASCHRKGSGATYPSVYGRMEWDRPSPTVTTQCFGYGNGRFGHPEQDRAITLREAAILQTFPPEYRFLPEGERPKFYLMGRLIGNAVPVRLGEMIAKSFRQHVEVARVA
jgi:DNA (cytosine-5)-methyltransferase 1